MIGLPQLLLGSMLAVFVAGGAGYWSGYLKGRAAGEEAVQARWQKERSVQQQAIDQARREAAAIERAAEVALEKQRGTYDAEIARRAADAAATGRELRRLRDAIATSSIGHRERARPPGAGSAPDGPAATTGKLLAACGQALVGMGEDARNLAAQVIGLQGYAKTAQDVCGR